MAGVRKIGGFVALACQIQTVKDALEKFSSWYSGTSFATSVFDYIRLCESLDLNGDDF